MDEAAWLCRRNAMGIVRLRGRDAVRLSTDARERDRAAGVSDAADGGSAAGGGRRSSWTVGRERETQRCPTGRGSVVIASWARGRRWPHEVSGGGVTCTRIAVICIRPSPHTGQRARSMPVSRCMSAAADSDGASSSRWLTEQGPAPRQRRSTRAIREQAEVANAHEAARHDVQEKASQEFVGLERHDLHAVVVGVVLPPKPDAAVTVLDEPIIRQRDAVRVPPEVVEHLLGAGEGPLRIHDPVDGPQLTEEAGEGVAIGQIGRATGEGELARRRRRVARPARYFARKTVDSARTGNRNDDRPAIHRERSAAKAPPVTRQCRWRCCERFCPHVCRIAVMPIVPPRCRGSRPKVSSVSAAARKRSA